MKPEVTILPTDRSEEKFKKWFTEFCFFAEKDKFTYNSSKGYNIAVNTLLLKSEDLLQEYLESQFEPQFIEYMIDKLKIRGEILSFNPRVTEAMCDIAFKRAPYYN